MKKVVFLTFFSLATCGWLSSCVDSQFLDETQTTDLSKEVIFSDSAYTAGFLNQAYIDMAFDVYPNRFTQGWTNKCGGLQSACDEGDFKVTSDISSSAMFSTGTVTANAMVGDGMAWPVCYRNIRRINVFLANVDNSPMAEMAKTRYKAEAHFLRAWYYFQLLRHYGGVPLLGDKILDDKEEIDMTRNTFAEVVDYIIEETKLAEADLSPRRSGTEMGRASAGACWGLLSRLYLYCASPLYNGTNITNDEKLLPLLGYKEFDQERWKTAADAALRIISTGRWQLFSYHKDPRKDNRDEPGWGHYAKFMAYDFMQQTEFNGKKFTDGAFCGHILVWRQGTAWNNDRECQYYPTSAGGNGHAGYPYHDLIECYPMLDGKTPAESKYAYNRIYPLQNRDPRLGNTFFVNGSIFLDGGDYEKVLKTYIGFGATQDAIGSGNTTGYYWRKGCHRDAAANWFVGVEQSYLLIHYAEILLNYAEAVNEYYGPDHVDAFGESSISPVEALRAIREYAGIEKGDDPAYAYGIKDGMSQDEMREAIRLERRIELAGEGHRFYDVRRWKIADQTDNATLHGLEITNKMDGSMSSRIVDVRTHVFRPAMYFWPIPYEEVIRSESLLQNPGY